MRLFTISSLLLSLTFLSTFVLGELEPGDRLPTCGLKCMIQYITPSHCTLTDIPCVCASKELNQQIGECVAASCSIRDQLTTQRYSKHSCNIPSRDRSKLCWVISWTGGMLALTAFTMRMYARYVGVAGKFWWDDWVLCIVILVMIPFTALAKNLHDSGFGKDIWEVSFDGLTHILKVYWADEMLYSVALPLTKISILCFYLRIFPEKAFKIRVYVLIALNLGYAIAFLFASMTQCRPLSGAWTRWDGTFEGTCNNLNIQGWMSAVFNIVLDVAVLALPLPELYNLAMSTKKKMHILVMFSVGFFVTILSILRLQSLVHFANTNNFSQDYAPMGFWSTIEVHTAILCACLPALRSLLRKWFPGSMLSSTVKDVSNGDSLDKSQNHIVRTIEIQREVCRPKFSDDNRSFIPLVNMESKGGKEKKDLESGLSKKRLSVTLRDLKV